MDADHPKNGVLILIPCLSTASGSAAAISTPARATAQRGGGDGDGFVTEWQPDRLAIISQYGAAGPVRQPYHFGKPEAGHGGTCPVLVPPCPGALQPGRDGTHPYRVSRCPGALSRSLSHQLPPSKAPRAGRFRLPLGAGFGPAESLSCGSRCFGHPKRSRYSGSRATS